MEIVPAEFSTRSLSSPPCHAVRVFERIAIISRCSRCSLVGETGCLGRPRGYTSWLAFLNTVRTERFDQVLALRPFLPAIAITKSKGLGMRVVTALAKQLNGNITPRAVPKERQRFTFRQTRRTVPITFSIMLVQASERRNSRASKLCPA
jgi:hypothetical protein